MFGARAHPYDSVAVLRNAALLVALALLSACGPRPEGPLASPPPQASVAPVMRSSNVGSSSDEVAGYLKRQRIALTRQASVTVIEAGRERTVRQLTDATYLWSPRWSPDRTRIAFVRGRTTNAVGFGGGDILLVGLDGSTRVLRPHESEQEEVLSLAWSPVGDALVIATLTPRIRGGNVVLDQSLLRYEIARDASTVLVSGAADPSLSSDGQRLAFLRVGETGTKLYVARSDGSDEREVRLTPAPAAFFAPRISPDGHFVIWVAARHSPALAVGAAPSRGRSRVLLDLLAGRAEAHGQPMEAVLGAGMRVGTLTGSRESQTTSRGA
ncbi:MAG: hypothetical protein U0360_01855 [Dehalococcoidia bacterium]